MGKGSNVSSPSRVDAALVLETPPWHSTARSTAEFLGCVVMPQLVEKQKQPHLSLAQLPAPCQELHYSANGPSSITSSHQLPLVKRDMEESFQIAREPEFCRW